MMRFLAQLSLCTLVVLALFDACSGSLCTIACDVVPGPRVTVCGTDNSTHKTSYESLIGIGPPYSCYRECNVGIQHVGSCECPNNCYSAAPYARGECTKHGCECKAGWGGRDCSNIQCPNECSGHGKCGISSASGLNQCVCESGFTGKDCSIKTGEVPLLPYGELFPGKYYANDQYGDDHPLFNISEMATINIAIDPKLFNALLIPANTWNQSKVKCELSFHNSKVDAKVSATIKIKGNLARMMEKKSWNIQFPKLFFGLDRMDAKAFAQDPTYIKAQLMISMYRAMMVPIIRGSFATLTINGVFWGIYYIMEGYEEQFEKSRFGVTGNLYHANDYLLYIGDDVQKYKDLSFPNKGVQRFAYDQKVGNGDWTDFVQLAKFANTTSDEVFESGFEKFFNVENFLRSLVIESAMQNLDGYTVNGENYMLFNNPKTKLWEFISSDFEDSFIRVSAEKYSTVQGNINAILAYRVLLVPKYKERFFTLYDIFMARIFLPELRHATIKQLDSFAEMITPIIKEDNMYPTSFLGFSDGMFGNAIILSRNWLLERFAFLAA